MIDKISASTISEKECSLLVFGKSFRGVILGLSAHGCTIRLLDDGIQKFQDLTVELVVERTVKKYQGYVVDSENSILWCRWKFQSNSVSSAENRKENRWNLNPYINVSGVFSNPANYDDVIYLRLVDVSATGIRFETSMRNIFLSPGVVLKGFMSFPFFGTVQSTIEVKWTNPTFDGDKGVLSVGSQLTKTSKNFLVLLSEYLAYFSTEIESTQYSEIIPNSLFGAREELNFVKSKESYLKVLDLRIKERGSNYSIFDCTSKILLVVDESGKPLQSFRYTLHNSNDKLECQNYFDLPEDFPVSHEILEISDMTVSKVSPSIFILIKQAILLAGLGGRKYIVGRCPEILVPTFKSLGDGVTTLVDRDSKRLVIFEMSKLISGKGMKASLWHSLCEETYQFAIEKGVYSKVSLDLKARMSRFFRSLVT